MNNTVQQAQSRDPARGHPQTPSQFRVAVQPTPTNPATPIRTGNAGYTRHTSCAGWRPSHQLRLSHQLRPSASYLCRDLQEHRQQRHRARLYRSGPHRRRSPSPTRSLSNGVLTISSSALGGSGQLTIPLAPGTASFGVGEHREPARARQRHRASLTTDGTFFYANLTPVNAPNQREFVAGGLPVGVNALRGDRLDPHRRLHRSARRRACNRTSRSSAANAGGNLANAYISPLYLVAPANTRDRRRDHGERRPRPAIEPRHQRPGRQSAIGAGHMPSARRHSCRVRVSRSSTGVVRARTSQLSPTSTPVRIGGAFTSTVDGNGNSLYGGRMRSQGFVLNQTQYETRARTAPPTTPGSVMAVDGVEVPLVGDYRRPEWRRTMASTSRRPPRACPQGRQRAARRRRHDRLFRRSHEHHRADTFPT